MPIRLLVAVVVVAGGLVTETRAACPETPAEQAAVVLARIAIDQACPCAAATDSRAYRRCANAVVKTQVSSGALPGRCAAPVRRCVRGSVCGQPGMVTCCTSNNGKTKCRVQPVARCNARGGISGSCTSCCESCNPSCLGTTTTTVPPACGESAPACNGSCAAGSHCDSFGPGDCGCLPDGQTGCGEGPFPTCGGACPGGLACQAVQMGGEVSFTGCQCVGAASTCGPPGSACSAPGRCPVGAICNAFAAGGTLECGCLTTTTTLVSSTTTTSTTLAPGTPCGDTAYPSCGGDCPVGESCQSVHATGISPPLDVRFCQCVSTSSACTSLGGGSCPGACPAGKACSVFVAGGAECGCTDP